MLHQLTYGSRWRTSSDVRSRLASTRRCERKKRPRLPCWQRGRRSRTLLLQLKRISRTDLQRRLSQELEMAKLLQITVQTPQDACSRHTERRKSMFGQHMTWSSLKLQ